MQNSRITILVSEIFVKYCRYSVKGWLNIPAALKIIDVKNVFTFFYFGHVFLHFLTFKNFFSTFFI